MKLYLVSILIATLLLGCTAKTATPTPGNLGIKQDVAIKNFAFDPQTVTVPVGTTVIWTNEDDAPHTVTSDTGAELDSPRIQQGETYAHTFTTPGTYTYYCSIHPSMKGTVIVQ